MKLLYIAAAISLLFFSAGLKEVSTKAEASPQDRTVPRTRDSKASSVHRVDPLITKLHHFRPGELSCGDQVFCRLLDGVASFESSVYLRRKNLFRQLTQGQHPEALFITCCDSRIDPNLITQAPPGELFLVRNIGNIVPPYDSGECTEGAAIEYAIKHLGVKHIIVCGHSQCGAMKQMIWPDSLDNLPKLARWLQHDARLGHILKKYKGLSKDELLQVAVQENILVQLENLRGYPPVAKAVESGKLKLHGWFYTLETGQIAMYSAQTKRFEAIRPTRSDVAHFASGNRH